MSFRPASETSQSIAQFLLRADLELLVAEEDDTALRDCTIEAG